MNRPIETALDGTLQRWPDGWRWIDGTPEPRARDLMLRDLAPNFRCATFGDGRAHVEIPGDWRAARHWPHGRVDTQVANEIAELLRDAGRAAPIYAEGLAELLDDHRLRRAGYLIDAAQWDAVMTEPCGVSWPKADEADFLARAAALASQ